MDIHAQIAALERAEDEGPYEAIDTRKLDELRADRNEVIQYTALAFAEAVGGGDPGVGGALTCREFDALIALYKALGRPQDDMDALLLDHQQVDEPGEDHYVAEDAEWPDPSIHSGGPA